MNTNISSLMQTVSQWNSFKYFNEAATRLEKKYPHYAKKEQVSNKDRNEQDKIREEVNRGNKELRESENKRTDELGKAAVLSKDAISSQRVAVLYEKATETVDYLASKGLTGNEKASEVDWDKFDDMGDPLLKDFMASIKWAVEYTQNGDQSAKASSPEAQKAREEYNEQQKNLAALNDKSIAELIAMFTDDRAKVFVSNSGYGNSEYREKFASSTSAEGLGVSNIKGFDDLKDKFAAGIDKINDITDGLMTQVEAHKKAAVKQQASIISIIDTKA